MAPPQNEVEVEYQFVHDYCIKYYDQLHLSAVWADETKTDVAWAFWYCCAMFSKANFKGQTKYEEVSKKFKGAPPTSYWVQKPYIRITDSAYETFSSEEVQPYILEIKVGSTTQSFTAASFAAAVGINETNCEEIGELGLMITAQRAEGLSAYFGNQTGTYMDAGVLKNYPLSSTYAVFQRDNGLPTCLKNSPTNTNTPPLLRVSNAANRCAQRGLPSENRNLMLDKISQLDPCLRELVENSNFVKANMQRRTEMMEEALAMSGADFYWYRNGLLLPHACRSTNFDSKDYTYRMNLFSEEKAMNTCVVLGLMGLINSSSGCFGNICDIPCQFELMKNPPMKEDENKVLHIDHNGINGYAIKGIPALTRKGGERVKIFGQKMGVAIKNMAVTTEVNRKALRAAFRMRSGLTAEEKMVRARNWKVEVLVATAEGIQKQEWTQNGAFFGSLNEMQQKEKKAGAAERRKVAEDRAEERKKKAQVRKTALSQYGNVKIPYGEDGNSMNLRNVVKKCKEAVLNGRTNELLTSNQHLTKTISQFFKGDYPGFNQTRHDEWVGRTNFTTDMIRYLRGEWDKQPEDVSLPTKQKAITLDFTDVDRDYTPVTDGISFAMET